MGNDHVARITASTRYCAKICSSLGTHVQLTLCRKWAARFEEFSAEDFADFSSTPSGLQYKIIEPGFGVKPLSGQKIKAHYAGYLYPSAAKFDSSYDRRSPLEFQVGVGRVIKGWDEALLDMQVGEKRMLKIPSNLAYGSRGAGGVIPPDATLVFYVELVTIAA